MEPDVSGAIGYAFGKSNKKSAENMNQKSLENQYTSETININKLLSNQPLNKEQEQLTRQLSQPLTRLPQQPRQQQPLIFSETSSQQQPRQQQPPTLSQQPFSSTSSQQSRQQLTSTQQPRQQQQLTNQLSQQPLTRQPSFNTSEKYYNEGNPFIDATDTVTSDQPEQNGQFGQFDQLGGENPGLKAFTDIVKHVVDNIKLNGKSIKYNKARKVASLVQKEVKIKVPDVPHNKLAKLASEELTKYLTKYTKFAETL